MSTTAAPGQLDIVLRRQHVPMSRLAKVEFRKALDTRAGRWFVISILGLVLVVEVDLRLRAPTTAKDFDDFLGIAGAVLGYFLPILIIMLVTSEASQRNGLVTFTLEPRRPRVVVAKFLAGLALAVAVMVLARRGGGPRHRARDRRRWHRRSGRSTATCSSTASCSPT